MAMPVQEYDWSCSACSLAWVERSVGFEPYANEQSAIEQIGYPQNINATYGLMDSSGSALRAVLRDTYGQDTEHDWLSFDEAYERFQSTTGMMSGVNWYHWVAVRGVQGSNLWIANSAPGYKGIFDVLSRADYERLGNFSVVWLV